MAMERRSRALARRERARRGTDALGTHRKGRRAERPVREVPPAGPPPEPARRPGARITLIERVELMCATGVRVEGLRTLTVGSCLDRLHAGLALAVGGGEALAALGLAPLPDEPFAWEGVPPAARRRVADVLALVDHVAPQLFGVEVRTACRRLLADVAAADPAMLRRCQARTLAGSILWAVAKGNGLFHPRWPTVGLLLAACGVRGSVSGRAAKLLEAVGAPPRRTQGTVLLGSVRYLTAGRREALHDLAVVVEEFQARHAAGLPLLPAEA